MPEPLIGLHSTKQTNSSSETGCETRAESRMAKHRQTQLEEVHYEITVGIPSRRQRARNVFLPVGYLGFCALRVPTRPAASLRNSSFGALAYTSAVCSFGSRQRLKAAAVIRNGQFVRC